VVFVKALRKGRGFTLHIALDRALRPLAILYGGSMVKLVHGEEENAAKSHSAFSPSPWCCPSSSVVGQSDTFDNSSQSQLQNTLPQSESGR
jgi:hypothetical protein